jgi:hypothetical protein
MKKKLLVIFIVLCWLALPGLAQVKEQRPGAGALESLKIGFITKRLNLTPEEAQRFWPIYNQYAGEIRQAYIVYRDRPNEIELDESLLNIRKKYNIEFSRVLSPDKVNQFFRADKDFSGFVQKEMQRRQMNKRPNGGGQ